MSISSRFFTANSAEFSASGSSSRSLKRVLLNPDVLKSAKIFAGDAIFVQPAELRSSSEPEAFAIGVAWPSIDVPPSTVYLSTSLMLTGNLRDGEKIRIMTSNDSSASRPLPDLKQSGPAQTISVKELDMASSLEMVRSDGNGNGKNEKAPDWLKLRLREILVDMKFVYTGLKLYVLYEGLKRVFIVSNIQAAAENAEVTFAIGLGSLSINDHTTPRKVWTSSWDTDVVIESKSKQHDLEDASLKGINNGPSGSQVQEGYTTVGGLDKQISQIRDLIEIPLTQPQLFKHFGMRPPKGVLLHGPPGTGKTHLARAVVSATRSSGTSVLTIAGSELSSAYHGETERRLRDVFDEARRKSPCIVILDEVDALAPKRESSADGGGGEVEKRVVATLLSILDGVDADGSSREERVIVIGTTNRPNSIDPALRRPGRFDREIEIGIPDAEARYSILRTILARTPHALADSHLRSVANRTHGYVGADLNAVIREAATIAIKRSTSLSSIPPDSSLSDLKLTSADIEAGLTLVQPSALRSITLEVPAVRWSDIGGQAFVAQKLRECVEWPLRYPDVFARLGVRPPRGVLLYGPPGCSKTLTARALATESGINFLAVKGPELLNKFVGESERAVRDTFRKARAAAPSIVFFDEIDALGTSRSGDGDANDRHNGVLTTLLNEMDGVQDLTGVTVVAATNRPEVIDSALMRPGRLDRILYVGPPDRAGRVEILHIRTGKMAVDSALDLEELADLTEGCSGAELAALCQDAALHAMQEDINASFVPKASFLRAVQDIRRQITPEVLARFEQWRAASGLTSA